MFCGNDNIDAVVEFSRFWSLTHGRFRRFRVQQAALMYRRPTGTASARRAIFCKRRQSKLLGKPQPQVFPRSVSLLRQLLCRLLQSFAVHLAADLEYASYVHQSSRIPSPFPPPLFSPSFSVRPNTISTSFCSFPTRWSPSQHCPVPPTQTVKTLRCSPTITKAR